MNKQLIREYMMRNHHAINVGLITTYTYYVNLSTLVRLRDEL